MTSGAAVACLKYAASFIDTFYPSISNNAFASTQTGWVVGGGAEWRVTQNWMLRGEYLHIEFDSFGGKGRLACTTGVGNCVGAGFSTTFAFNQKFKEDLGRILLSYRF